MDKKIGKELTFDDFYENLFQTIIDELETTGMALVQVNGKPIGIFKNPKLTEGRGGSNSGVKESVDDNVLQFEAPKSIN